MKKDLIASALLLAVAAAYYVATVRIPVSTLADEVGPHGLPKVLAIALAVVAVGLGVRALIAKRPVTVPETAANDDDPEATPLRALGLLGIGALYMLAAWILGYVPALILLILGIALYEGMRPSWRVVGIAIGGATLFWLLFVVLLGVPQTAGLLF